MRSGTASRAVSTSTGSVTPARRTAASTSMPSFSGRPEVEHRGGVGLGAQLALGGHAVAHPVDLEAELAQAGAQAVAEQRVVFGEQDAHGA